MTADTGTPAQDRREARLLLSDGLEGQRGAVIALALWSAVEAVPALFSGILVALAIDDGFLAGDFVGGIATLGIYAAIVAVGAFGTRQAVPRMGALVEHLRHRLVSRAVTATMLRGVLGDAVGGREIEAATKHPEIIKILSSQLLSVARTAVLSVVFVIVGLFQLAPLVAVATLGSTAAVVLVLVLTARRWQRRIRDSLLAEERLSASASRTVGGLRDVVALGAAGRARRDLIADIDRHVRAGRAVGVTTANRVALMTSVARMLDVVLLVTAPLAVSTGTMTAGQLLGAATYLIGSIEPLLRTIVVAVGDVGLQIGVLAERVAGYCRVPEPPAGGSEGTRPDVADPALELVGTTFGYSDTSELVLDRVDLRVTPGERVVVVGPSGAGKSTLANLVAGLETPQRGTVRIGGVDLDALDPRWRHDTVTLLPQEAYVFAGGVRENLAYLHPDASDTELVRAAVAVGADRLVDGFGGLDGVIEAPSQLSEGQKQLVALTRALAAPSRLVLLDEATCHLHPAAERRAEEAFAASGRTLLVIAHRMSSAMRADRVVVLHGGSLEVGTHDELRTRSPLYADLIGHWNEV